MAKDTFYNLIINPEKIAKNNPLGQLPSSKEVVTKTVKIAWPTVVDSFLSAIVSFVDMAMVSSLGTTAITSVGLTTQPRFIMLAAFMALNVAVTAVVARRYGQEDRESANDCLHQMLSIGLVLGLILGAVGFIFARPFMLFAGALDDTIDGSTAYFKVLMIGLVFNALTININAAQRGVGNTKISLTTNLTANIVNIIFNYLLINGRLGFPRLELVGAGIATSFGMFVSFIIAVVSLIKKKGYLKLVIKKMFHFTKSTMLPLWRIWWSAAVEQLFMRFGFFLFAIIVAKLGTDAFAVHQVGMNVMNLSFAFGEGLSVAAAALVGQSLGRGRSDIAEIYGKTCRRIGMFFSVILFFTFSLLGRQIFSIFIKEEQLLNQGQIIMYFAAVITMLQLTQVIYNGALRGAGDVKFVAIMMMVCVAIVRPLFAYLLAFVLNYGIYGIWGSFVIDQALRFLMSRVRFSRGKWKKIEV